MIDFKHRTPIQLRFKDVDAMGHINNANHLSYVELARLYYFRDVIGADSDWSRQEDLILARIEVNYRNALFFGDSIAVYMRCSRIGNKSFELSWVIARESEAEAAVSIADGKAVLSCYDYTTRQAIPVSDERVRLLEEFEGKSLRG